MRLTWVSRAERDKALAEMREALDECKAALRRIAAECDWFRADAEKKDARFDSLLAKYQQLKLQGFTEPAPVVIPSKETPDPVRQAIASMSRGDPQLRRIMEDGVARDRAAGVDEGTILVGIWRGQSMNPDDPSNPGGGNLPS